MKSHRYPTLNTSPPRSQQIRAAVKQSTLDELQPVYSFPRPQTYIVEGAINLLNLLRFGGGDILLINIPILVYFNQFQNPKLSSCMSWRVPGPVVLPAAERALCEAHRRSERSHVGASWWSNVLRPTLFDTPEEIDKPLTHNVVAYHNNGGFKGSDGGREYEIHVRKPMGNVSSYAM